MESLLHSDAMKRYKFNPGLYERILSVRPVGDSYYLISTVPKVQEDYAPFAEIFKPKRQESCLYAFNNQWEDRRGVRISYFTSDLVYVPLRELSWGPKNIVARNLQNVEEMKTHILNHHHSIKILDMLWNPMKMMEGIGLLNLFQGK
jgi:hypothetical protein